MGFICLQFEIYATLSELSERDISVLKLHLYIFQKYETFA